MTDLSSAYMSSAQQQSQGLDAREMQDWLRSVQSGDMPLPDTGEQQSADPSRPPPAGKPIRRATDSAGRPVPANESTAGRISKNVGELIPQAAAGVHDAVHNALSFIDPLANWLNENVADLSYKLPIDQPQTLTGQISRKMSEFLTGFIPAVKGLKAIGVTGKITNPVAAGALADFVVRDPHEGRLSDVWNEAGLPKNVLTEYLRSKPDDTEVESRFKNSAESAMTGLGLEGVMLGARALRAARNVKEVKQTEETYLRAKYGEVTDEKIVGTGLGDVRKPAVEIVKSGTLNKIDASSEAVVDPRALIRKKGAASPEDFDVYVNFAKIDEPDQIKFTIGKMAEAYKGRIDEARRGVITQEETAKMAQDLGMSVEDLLARRAGQPLNAEEAVAARQLWAASGEKLVELAKKAADPNAGALDQFAFRKMMATHAAIQAEVIGARTETARALASWAIPAGGGVEKARAIEQILQATGGTQTSAEMARRLALLSEAGASPDALARFAQRGFAESSVDALKEIWVNGLLSAPKTHVVNTAGNTIVAFQQIYERKAAEMLGQLTGGGGVAPGEASAMAYGLIGSIRDAFRMSAKALKTGESSFTFSKVDIPRPNAISPEAFRMSRETGLGRFVDYLGSTVNVPNRLLLAEDEFFKIIGYRMEIRAQALRSAYQEGNRGADLARRMGELVDNPPEHIRINAADAALYSTFTNEMGAFGRAVMGLRNIDHPLNPSIFVLPFVRTPVNIARYAFERTPFAPLVSQWRADIAAGGARADLALARMSTGTAIMLTALDMANNGQISGDGPKGDDKAVREAMMRDGWQPYSVKVGDRWYSYNRLDPFGMTVGFAASISEAVRKGEIDENDVDEWQEVAAMAIAATSQVAISKTYLDGFARFVEVMTDPKRYSESYIKDLFGSFLPATSLNAAVKNMVDPVQRETGTPMEAVQARIAGLSDNLPPKRDLWGKEITTESGLGRVYDSLSPVASKPDANSPIDKELTRLNDGPQRIGKKTSFAGVQVNFKQFPKAYDEYVRLAGNDLKHPAWGMGAKDYLDAVVSGQHPMSSVYNMMSDESRKEFIKSAVSDYRKLAAQQVLGDPRFKSFAADYGRLRELQQSYKMPVLGDQQ